MYRLFFSLIVTRIKSNKTRPRVLITSPSLDPNENVSGISTSVRLIMNRCSCDFVHFRAGRKDNEKTGIRWFAKQILLPFRFAKQIAGGKIDLVHLNTALSRASIIRDFCLAAIAVFLGKPLIVHSHGGIFLFKETPGIITNYLAGELFYSSSAVIVLSEAEGDRLQNRWPGLAPKVLPNSVEPNNKEAVGDRDQTITIAFLGRIEKAKGVDEIVSAVRILKNANLRFRFTCYGSGDQKVSFAASMREIIGEDFEYRGVASAEITAQALAEADVFLIPSHYEGLPYSMLEAMAAGCIVVASNVGSIDSVISDGENGYLIEPHSASQIAEALKPILSQQVDVKQIGEAARATIEERFNIEHYAKALETIYNETI